MSQLEDITRFLNVMAETERTKPISGAKKAMLPFVTISRQAGAGGHTLAQTLVQWLEQEMEADWFHGWQVCDQSLCDIFLRDTQLQVSVQSLLTEEFRSQIHAFVTGLFGRKPDQYRVMQEMFETVRALAAVGKVILVGRGGCLVTRKLELGVHVRLVAPEADRVQSMMQMLHKHDEDEVRRIVRRQDADRARLLKAYFQADIDDALLYDMVWNTSTVDFETIARSIIALVKQRIRARYPDFAPA